MNSNKSKIERKKALKHAYKAVAFDIDGTLTSFPKPSIPRELIETLIQLPQEMPLAICSGRPLAVVKDRLDQVFAATDYPNAERKRWYIIADNGSSVYQYNSQEEDYECVFDLPWPSKLIEKDSLEAFVLDRLGWPSVVDIREYTVVVLFHPWFYVFPKVVRRLSNRAHSKLEALFKEMDIDKGLQVKNSGLGNLIIPTDGGKGKAVKRWAKHLGLDTKEILCIGDQPGPGGNDEDFLDGENGVPFTVGEQTDGLYPFPVLDEHGKILRGPEATAKLLKQIFVKSTCP